MKKIPAGKDRVKQEMEYKTRNKRINQVALFRALEFCLQLMIYGL